MDAGRLFLELGGVFFGLGVLAVLANRVRMSAVPLYLLAGLAFGTGGLHSLDAASSFIETGSEIGVVLLLLTLGLEYSAGELVGQLRRQAPAGVVDLVLNATPGVLAAVLLGWGPAAAVALGGVTAVSSSGIIAKVLFDLERLGNRETPVVLGLLVLEDLAMAVYLPVLTAVLASNGLGSAALGLAGAVATLVVVLFIALWHGGTVSRLVFSTSSEVLLLRVLGLTLLVAGLAEELHVSAAVGAFLVGIALSGPVAEGAREVLAPLRDLFSAAFFVFFGLQTDPADLPGVLPVALALAAAGIVTKATTGWYAARRAGIGVPGQIRAAAVLVPRGEFSIIIATLAVGAGVEPRLAPVATAYVLVMAVIGPLLPRLTDPLARRAAVRGRVPAPVEDIG